MFASDWTRGQGEERDLHLGSGIGSTKMEKYKPGSGSVWGAEEAFLSPPEYGGSLGASCESEESSEDCEDYVSGLAEEIARSMLQEDEEAQMESAPRSVRPLVKSAWSSGDKMSTSPTSPQSTLAGMCCNWEGNTGSSGVSSPCTPREGETREVLYPDVLRLKLEDQAKLACQQRLLSPQQQIIQRPTPAACKLPADDALSFVRSCGVKVGLRARSKDRGQEPDVQFRGGSGRVQVGGAVSWGCGALCQPQPTTKRGGGAGKGTLNNVNKGREEQQAQQFHQFSLFASNMDPVDQTNVGSGGWMVMMMRKQQQQQQGGMRAVFLGNRDQCGGTGVFLPRRFGSSHDSRRQPDFLSASTVRCWNSQSSSRKSKPKDEVSASSFPKSHPTTLQEVAPDINLPSEWTY